MSKQFPPYRILVIDDNHDAAELFQMILQTEGYEVRIALDEVAGLQQASAFHPHVICSDQPMPLLSGSELALEFRKSDHSKEAYLIAMTCLDDDETRRNLTAAGFDACFCKPLEFDQFFEPLKSYFRQLTVR